MSSGHLHLNPFTGYRLIRNGKLPIGDDCLECGAQLCPSGVPSTVTVVLGDVTNLLCPSSLCWPPDWPEWDGTLSLVPNEPPVADYQCNYRGGPDAYHQVFLRRSCFSDGFSWYLEFDCFEFILSLPVGYSAQWWATKLTDPDTPLGTYVSTTGCDPTTLSIE